MTPTAQIIMAGKGTKRGLDSDDNEFSPNVKKAKVESDDVAVEAVCENIISRFKMSNVLSVNAREKKIIVNGKLADQDAVVILEKTPFTEDTLAEMFNGSTVKPDMTNYIYSTYHLQASPHLNEIKTTLVCPVTKNRIRKYIDQESVLVEETRIDYEYITLPFIEKHKSFSLQWVYNILQKRAEVERIVFEDPHPQTGFVLLPDFKWDQKQEDDLYLIAIIRRRNIRTLRDLTAQHIPMLMNVFCKGQMAVLEHYSLPASKLRVYVHYQPAFYHLHIHFTKLGFNPPSCGVERSHLLADVIQNLQCDSYYYQKRTMYYPLREDSNLLSKFKAAGRV